MERPVHIAVAVIALFGLPKLFTGITFGEGTVFLAGLLTLGVAHVLVAVDCLWTRRFGWSVAMLTALGTTLIVGAQLAEPAPAALWRTDAWFGTVLTYGVLLLGRRPQLVLLMGSFGAGLMVLAVAKDLGGVPQVLSVFYTASGIGVLWVARHVTGIMVEDYLASRLERVERKQEAAESAAQAEALAALRREMHDSLLHTLQRMGASWSTAGPEEIRTSCREAAAQLAVVPRPAVADGVVNVCSVLQEALPSGRHVLTCAEPEILLPEAVAAAFVGATREAVRNVLKHTAGVPEVRIERLHDGVQITVTDDGPGFDVERHRGTSLGLEASVLERMAAVGGQADLDSGAGGTTVKLRWPALPPPGTGLGVRARRLVAWLPLPLVAASLVHVLTLGWPDLAVPLAVHLTVSAAIVCGALRLRRGSVAVWQAVGLCVLGMAAFGYNYAVLAGAPSNDYDLWAPSLFSAVLIIGLTSQRIKVAVTLAVLVLVGAVGISGYTLGWRATLTTHFGGVLAVLLYTVVTLVLVIGATSISRHLHTTRRLAAAAELHEQARRVRDAVWEGWLARADTLVGPFLADVAAGRRDPQSVETRATAARLAARVRDELFLWPGSLELATELDRLRGLGWDARLLNAELAQSSAELLTVLHAIAEPPREGAQVLVTAQGNEAVVTVTPGIRLRRQHELQRWLSIDDPEVTQFRTNGGPASD